jgi:hypothetical protein
MQALTPFTPRLIGSVATGYVRSGSDVDIHVFAWPASSARRSRPTSGAVTSTKERRRRSRTSSPPRRPTMPRGSARPRTCWARTSTTLAATPGPTTSRPARRPIPPVTRTTTMGAPTTRSRPARAAVERRRDGGRRRTQPRSDDVRGESGTARSPVSPGARPQVIGSHRKRNPDGQTSPGFHISRLADRPGLSNFTPGVAGSNPAVGSPSGEPRSSAVEHCTQAAHLASRTFFDSADTVSGVGR